jgi:nucleoside-diphosphate-sugar epimerase
MPVPDFDGVAVLVTGGAGFIGSHLVDALLARGAQVRVLDNFATGKPENLAPGRDRLEVAAGDLRDAEACRRACDGCRIVFHQAALGSVPRSVADPATTVAVNVLGTAHLFKAALDAGAERVVYASSSSVYGDQAALPKREGEEGSPLSPYAASKAATEELAAAFAASYGGILVGLRYFNVYGPRQDPEGPYAAVIPRFLTACLAGEPCEIFGDGEQSRDFTYVEDAVTANLLAAGAAAGGRGAVAVNVGGGSRTTINELAAAVQRLTGARRGPVHLPPRPGDVRHSLADLGRAEVVLGYRPAWSLEAGLATTLAHAPAPGRAAASGLGAAPSP